METINVKELFNSPNVSSTQVVSEVELQKVINILTDTITELENNPIDSRPYKVYTAQLYQFGDAAPVATVLENTLGDIVWTRNAAGDFRGTLVGAFPVGKVFIAPLLTENGIQVSFRVNDDQIRLDVGWDSIILPHYSHFEIRVYN